MFLIKVKDVFLLFTAFLYFLVYGTTALAIPLTLKGDPVDYEYESDKVCCIDVAAVNLLNYLDHQKGNEELIPIGKSVKDQQEDFHKKYDPTFQKQVGDRNDLKKGLEDTFNERKFNADVKLFLTNDLTYDTILKEWNDDELIILLAREVDQGWGHALFLWGLETDKNNPRLAVTDSNVHPNTDHKIDGTNTNSKGTATWSNLSIGVDNNNSPDWRITLNQPEYTYTTGNLTETFDAVTFKYRITAFASISDVSPIPEPNALLLFGTLLAFIIIGGKRNRNRSRKERFL